jgi:hypothetical protein
MRRSALFSSGSAAIIASTLLGVMIIGAPFGIDARHGTVNVQSAFAKGNGNGNGGDHGNSNGGGNGNANGGNHGNANGAGNAGGDTGNSASASSKNSGEDDAFDGEDDGTGPGQGSVASSLGALNAAHASTTALNNAAPNSRVGKIAAFKEAGTIANEVDAAEDVVNDPNATPEAKAQAQAFLDSVDPVDPVGVARANEQATLDAAANKTVTDQVMDRVRDLLGLN